MSHYGIETSSWFRITGDCTVSFTVCGGEAEFTLGGRDHDIQFNASPTGLERLIAVASQALADLERG